MARKLKNEKQPNGTGLAPQGMPTSSDATIRNSDLEMSENMDTSEDTVAGGSLEVLGRGVKELVQAVQELRHLGVEDLVLPLPKIVVVGDQSTGKSSLIEGMSEIKVPRASDTCTRCPLEINLTEGSEEWSCKVSICKKYTYTGKLGPSRGRTLGPWAQQDREDIPFATINDVSEVANVLFLAQLAVLNPSDNPLKYAYAAGKPSPAEVYQVKFSPNVIQLDICGPGLPNLSFTDLPGVINVADVPEETYLVDLVNNLVKGYVHPEGCINLLAIPMTDDPANSSASKLLRQLHAEDRTVGCITKPDRFTSHDAPDQWARILQGIRFPLGYGYFVIKNNPDSSVDHATARNEETAFFNEEEPWTTTFKPHHKRFGTHRLQTSLSQLLTEQIQKSLPRIQDQVMSKACFIDEELRSLPAPVAGNLPVLIGEELGKFSNLLQNQVDGGSSTCEFQRKFHEIATNFRGRLANTKPITRLRSHSHALPMRGTPNGNTTPTPVSRTQDTTSIIDLSDDEEAPSPPIRRSSNKRAIRSSIESPSKLQRIDSPFATPSLSQKAQPKCFELQEVRDIIHRNYISLPGQVDPKAIEELISMSMQHWRGLLNEFFVQVRKLCSDMVVKQVEEVFGHRSRTKFFDELREACRYFLEDAISDQLEQAQRILHCELSKPKTLNEYALFIARDSATTLLRTERRKVLAEPYLNEQERKSGKPWTDTQREEKLAKVPDSELLPETYLPELKALAETKAYYEVAYNRFVDIVFMSIHCELFHKCRDGLVPSLKLKFDLYDDNAQEKLAILLAGNPQDEMRRVVLIKEKATIKQALTQLRALSY